MKTLALITLFVVFLGCATIPQEIAIQKTIYPEGSFPQRNAVPMEVLVDVTENGWEYLGHFVSDVGGILIFAEKDNECKSLVFIPGAPTVYSGTCEEGLELYYDLCIIDGGCDADPLREEGLQKL